MVSQLLRMKDAGVRRIVLSILGTVTAVVLLFGYRTSSATPGTASTVAAASAPDAASDATAPAGATTTYLGDAVGTRWGDVQVQITVASGVITAVDAVEVPSGNQRDIEINDRAVPILAAEALQAQSADVDTVSGATVTSDGYLASLQSAIDQAGL